MSRDTRHLIKALESHRQQSYLTSQQVAMAATILAVDGIEAALVYVDGLPDSKPSLQAAFEFHIEGLEQAAMAI